MLKKYCLPLLSLAATLSISALIMPFAQAAGNTFTVTNNSKSNVVRVDVSEDGSNWLDFEGSQLKPGETKELDWGINSSNCIWQARANFEDGTISEPKSFDFCKDPNLVINN